MRKLTKVQLLGIIFIILLVLGLLATLYLVKMPQEIRKKAAAPAGSQKIGVIVVPDKTTLALNGTTNVKVYLKNISTSSQLVRVAGVDLSLSNTNLTIANINCNSTLFPNSVAKDVVGNIIYLSCYGKTPLANLPSPTPIPISPGSQVILGSFDVNGINTGSTVINVIRTSVPEATTSVDMADNGTGVTFTVSGGLGAGPTITPTVTPTVTLTQKIAVIVDVPDKPDRKLTVGETVHVKVYLKNISATSQLVRVAGVDLTLTNLTASNATCNTTFFPNSNPSNDADKIVGNSIYFTCYGKTPLSVPTPTPLPPTPTPIPIASGSQVLFASFDVRAVSAGVTTKIIVIRTAVPDAVTSVDMADNGTGVTFTVSGGLGSGTTVTPTPFGSGESIDIGTKQDLTINIGGGGPLPTIDPNTPQIKFKIALESDKKPEIKVRLKVTDLALMLSHPPTADDFDSCTQTQAGEYVYHDIPMVYGGSDVDINGVNYQVYQLKSGAAFQIGTDQNAISADGWLPLVGTTGNTIYSLSLKGEKHRSMKMIEKMFLNSGQPLGQEFNWVNQPLEPGDLPDPNNSLSQDCTVNSIDIALIESRIAATDNDSLTVADVNYDEVVNGNDVAKVAHTLSTKPDDE